jgi:putative colanic acid biosynthesis acetyltransferase WcaF
MEKATVICNKVDLSKFNNDWYSPGASVLKRGIWFLINAVFFINPLNPISNLKVGLLRVFGSKVGKGVIIKPNVNIKYPWKLQIGNNVWIGEGVWIDNLAPVIIHDNTSVSQGALLLTGSHNYKNIAFDLIVKGIILENGVWIGARSIVCPGVTCQSHSILTVGSVATKDMEAYFIYQGVPAEKKRKRTVDSMAFEYNRI